MIFAGSTQLSTLMPFSEATSEQAKRFLAILEVLHLLAYPEWFHIVGVSSLRQFSTAAARRETNCKSPDGPLCVRGCVAPLPL